MTLLAPVDGFRPIGSLLAVWLCIGAADAQPDGYWQAQDAGWRFRSAGMGAMHWADHADAITYDEFTRYARDPASVPHPSLSGYTTFIPSSTDLSRIELSATLNHDSLSNLGTRKYLSLHLGLDQRWSYFSAYKDSTSGDTSYHLTFQHDMRNMQIALGIGYSWRSRGTRSFYLTYSGRMDLATTVASSFDTYRGNYKEYAEWSSGFSSATSVKAVGITTLRFWLKGGWGFRIARRLDMEGCLLLGNGLDWHHGRGIAFIPWSAGVGASWQWLIRR